ncbi:MAG: hypothetical protein JNN15_06785 [Blastocatellia bacterium]|nr:hypothetical protein [Blastocatellia bacterium]
MQIYWTAYDRLRFAARNILESADRSEIRSHNSFWPAGTTIEDVEAWLKRTVSLNSDKLKVAKDFHCGAGFSVYEFKLDNGIVVRLGINSHGRITLFQPLTGPNVIRVDMQEAEYLFSLI